MKQTDKTHGAIKAIIGLGNPGHQYEKTRHNIGFRVVDRLVEKYGGTWHVVDQSVVSTISVHERNILVVKPLTFMNASGKVLPLIKKHGASIEELLVVHDELDFPFGKIGFKCGGSARGHNGLKSIIALGGDAFCRVRCGIGRPANAQDVPDYVLARFSESETEVAEMIEEACSAVEKVLLEGA